MSSRFYSANEDDALEWIRANPPLVSKATHLTGKDAMRAFWMVVDGGIPFFHGEHQGRGLAQPLFGRFDSPVGKISNEQVLVGDASLSRGDDLEKEAVEVTGAETSAPNEVHVEQMSMEL